MCTQEKQGRVCSGDIAYSSQPHLGATGSVRNRMPPYAAICKYHGVLLSKKKEQTTGTNHPLGGFQRGNSACKTRRVHTGWCRLHEVPDSQDDLWQRFSTRRDCVSQETSGNVWSHFWLSPLDGEDTSVQWVEVRDAANNLLFRE